MVADDLKRGGFKSHILIFFYFWKSDSKRGLCSYKIRVLALLRLQGENQILGSSGLKWPLGRLGRITSQAVSIMADNGPPSSLLGLCWVYISNII